MRIYTIFLILFLSKSLISQTDFYSIDSIREIRIYFEENNWDQILDNYYADGMDQRLAANLTIDGVYYPGVGVRYKGYSSYSPSRVKNPFNISSNIIFVNNEMLFVDESNRIFKVN